MRSVAIAGLRALGIEIEEEDLTPERKRRAGRARMAFDEKDAVVAMTLRLPRYVRVRAEEYLAKHPEMRFRHLVMAGFRKLGIDVKPEDVIAERRNITASSLRPQHA